MNTPILVESTIKNIMNSQLNDCKKDKFSKNSMILNISLFFMFCTILSFILFIQYKGNKILKNVLIKITKREILYYLNYKFFKK